MGEVDELIGRATKRFKRLKDLEEESIEEYDRITALFSLLNDEYDEAVMSLRERVDELENRVESVEDKAETITAWLPETGRQDTYDDIKELVDEASFPDCVTRDEFARKYC